MSGAEADFANLGLETFLEVESIVRVGGGRGYNEKTIPLCRAKDNAER